MGTGPISSLPQFRRNGEISGEFEVRDDLNLARFRADAPVNTVHCGNINDYHTQTMLIWY
jgi:hypothetical protein